MKKKLTIFIFAVTGLILIIFAFLQFMNKNDSIEDKKLRKIYEEEINHETAKEIMQFYILKEEELKNEKIIFVKLIAADDNGEYLVRVELESNPGELQETTMQYLGDGEWEVHFPLGRCTNYSDRYTKFWPEVSPEDDI